MVSATAWWLWYTNVYDWFHSVATLKQPSKHLTKPAYKEVTETLVEMWNKLIYFILTFWIFMFFVLKNSSSVWENQ